MLCCHVNADSSSEREVEDGVTLVVGTEGLDSVLALEVRAMVVRWRRADVSFGFDTMTVLGRERGSW